MILHCGVKLRVELEAILPENRHRPGAGCDLQKAQGSETGIQAGLILILRGSVSPGDTWSSVGLGVSQEGRCSKLVLQEKDETRLDVLGWRGTGWCT